MERYGEEEVPEGEPHEEVGCVVAAEEEEEDRPTDGTSSQS